MLAPGVGYGVAWDARNTDFGEPGHLDEVQHPAEFLRSHRGDLVWCDADKIYVANTDDRSAYDLLLAYLLRLAGWGGERGRQANVFAVLLAQADCLTAHLAESLAAWATARADAALTALTYNAAVDEDLV